MYLLIIIFSVVMGNPASGQNAMLDLQGAWKSDKGVVIFSGDYFSYALFDASSKEFIGTYGGSWTVDNNTMSQMLEFNTFNEELVGQHLQKKISIEDNKMVLENDTFERIDDGQPGKLKGAWLFSGRKRDGQIQTRDTDQPRKTMKILSGTRFQWIAYNVETGSFSGTGGGTYTTTDNKYIERIDFFSRDNSRVGASLNFNFEIIEGIWHHSGLNSRGEPLYETWSPR
jgi:hypothetical protein